MSDELRDQIQKEIESAEANFTPTQYDSPSLDDLLLQISTLETYVNFLYEHLVLEKPEI